MEKAANKEALIKAIAEGLSIGGSVYFDPDTLEYGSMTELDWDEYGDYLDMAELPDDIDELLPGWQSEHVKYLRELTSLPHSIEDPMTRIKFDWMIVFANEQSLGDRFVNDTRRALDNRHPFRNFKDVMKKWGIEKEWFACRQSRYEEYVRKEIESLVSKDSTRS